MSTIRCIYHPQDGKPMAPSFPATDQHPDAVRYLIGLYYVDAIGGEPTQTEIDAIINPPPSPAKLSDGQLSDLLVAKGVLSAADVQTAVAADVVK